MARKVQISKDIILQAALDMLIQSGYPSINIKTLSNKIGCSTQPIVWHFDNMDGLRRELFQYTLNYAGTKMRPDSNNGFEAFTKIGAAYVDIAFDEPELFKYLFMNQGGGYCVKEIDLLFSAVDNQYLVKSLADLFQISPAAAVSYLTDSVIYSTGILSLIVSGVLKCPKEKVKHMIDKAGYAFLLQAGAPLEIAEKIKNYLNPI